jgi:gliding motility-associated-like protein
MKKILLSFFCLSLFFSLHSQTPSSGSFCNIDSSQFRIIEVNEVNFVKQTPDSGTLGVGFWAQGYEGVVFKLNADRRHEWSKIFRGQGRFLIDAVSVDQADGSIYLASGNKLIKLDAEGNLIWGREFSLPYTDSYAGIINKIHITDDQQLYLLFSQTSYREDPDSPLIGGTTLLKLDEAGNKIWVRSYLDFAVIHADFYLVNNKILLSGTDNINRNIGDGFTNLLSIDFNGNILSAKRIAFNEPTRYIFRPIIQKEGGGAFLGLKGEAAGAGSFESILVSLDENLEVEWARQWGMQPNLSYSRNMWSLRRSPQGGYLAFSEEPGSRRAFTYHLDENGTVDWLASHYHRFLVLDSELEVFDDGSMAYSGTYAGSSGFLIFADERGFAGECGRETAEGVFSEVDVKIQPNENVSKAILPFIINAYSPSIEDYSVTLIPTCVTEYPDLDISVDSISKCGVQIELVLNICNVGLSDFTETSSLAVYEQNPTQEAATLIGSIPLTEDILQDSCKRITAQLTTQSQADQVFILVNNEGNNNDVIDLNEASPLFLQKECTYTNNLDSIAVPQSTPFSLGPDQTICEEEMLVLAIPNDFVRYDWTTSDPSFNCENCREFSFQPMSDLAIYFEGQNVEGCLVRDTVRVKAVSAELTQEKIFLCPGESTMVFGEVVNQSGLFEQVFQNSYACDSVHQVKVEVASPMVLNIQTQEACSNQENGRINVEVTAGSVQFYWPDLNATGPVQEHLPAGIFRLQVTDEFGCMLDTMVVLNNPSPAPQIVFSDPGPVQLKEGGSLTFTPEIIGGTGEISFKWKPGYGLSCIDCAAPLAEPEASTWYTLEVEDEKACSDRDSVLVEVEKNRQIFVPNVFSPNGDGVNDYFYIMTGSVSAQIKSFRVFDRWGNLVFEKMNFVPNVEQEGWNGRYRGEAVPKGTYIFAAEIDFGDGEVELISGEIHLLR